MNIRQTFKYIGVIFLTLLFVWGFNHPLVKQWFFMQHCLKTETRYISPLYCNDKLIVRNDNYGDGSFGAKRNGGRTHRGVDLNAKIGTGVVTVKSGIVVTSTCQPKGMGEYIEVLHFDKTKTLYGHLSGRFVRQSEVVKQGQVIGSVGKTGNAYNKNMITHLHYELWINGRPVDPMRYLSASRETIQPEKS